MRRVLALLAPSLLVPVPALADVTAGGVTIPCYCRDTYGERREVGEEVCLVVDGRAFMGRCEMALNVTIWRDTGAGCVSSRLERGPHAGRPVLEPGAVDAEVGPTEAQS